MRFSAPLELSLIHIYSFDGTLADYNRCGVPLIEMVSEPDLRSAEEAKAYMEALSLIHI